MKFGSGVCFFLFTVLVPQLVEYVICSNIEDTYRQHVDENKVRRFDLETAKNRPIRVKEGSTRFTIFCYDGEPKKKLSRLFTSVGVKIVSVGDNVLVYVGRNETEVFSQHISASSSWLAWMARSPLTDSVAVATFNKTCVGVESDQAYSVQLIVKLVDPLCVGLLVAGLILFFSARRLSRNVVFYYGTGVSVGMVASVLIIIFIFTRIIPKKSFALYGIWLGGGSVILFLWKHVYDNLQSLLESYLHIVLGYLGLSAMLSFAVCYYKGPPTEPRKLDLIQWTIQLLALLMIFNSSQIVEVSVVILALTFTCYFFPASAGRAVQTYWRRKFPPRIKLLTMEEYEQQAEEETRKALEELRNYCRSPDCDAWKTISRLNSPRRFASWVEGDSFHVTDDEYSLYDSHPRLELPGEVPTDSEDDVDFALSSL